MACCRGTTPRGTGGDHRVRLLGLRSSSRLAGVTITIIMLVQKGGSRWGLALDRVGQVILASWSRSP